MNQCENPFNRSISPGQDFHRGENYANQFQGGRGFNPFFQPQPNMKGSTENPEVKTRSPSPDMCVRQAQKQVSSDLSQKLNYALNNFETHNTFYMPKRNLKALEKLGSIESSQPQICIDAASSSVVSNNMDMQLLNSIKVPNLPPGQKRRGRKRERDDYYFLKAVKKIEEIRVKLKTAKADGLTVKQR